MGSILTNAARGKPTRWARYRLAVVLALTIIGLSLFDRVLANIEYADLAIDAQRDYERGMHFLAARNAVAAVNALRSARAESRENLTYELALIRALGEAERFSDANTLMDEVRLRYPNDGNFNMTAARLAARQGNEEGAEAYYHRAIFGQWTSKSGKAAASRDAARMELIDYLAAKGRLQRLTAELISLEAEMPPTASVEKKIARLFLVAGAPARAATAWQSYLTSNPSDVEAWMGLADAEIQLGDYRRARSASREALRLDPDKPEVKVRDALVELLTALDPTPHQLPAAEKHARASRILDLANADLARCSPSTAAINGAKLDAEQVLAAAEKTWQQRIKTCAGISKDEDALRLIMNKLSAQ
jgi:thioredoxin-like negative regulator of GroEL